MSKMKELYEKVSKDAALQAKFADILSNAEKVGEDAAKESLVQFAKEEGFEITIDEMQMFFKDLMEKDHSELSTAELDMVAGGKVNATKVLYSIVTIGIGCAVDSIMLNDYYKKYGDMMAYDCVGWFHSEN